jgi:hypothetical protein
MGIVSENALILVAVIPQVKDLEIARLLGWYRIPLRMAPKIIDVDFIAFYQPGTFGAAHRWKVEHFASVLGHELTTRAAILLEEPDHPRAREEYYKVQIGPLQSLSTPIMAKDWKRITFLYSLGSLFNRAVVINDLVVRSDERLVLWQSLRERNVQSYAQKNYDQTVSLDDAELIQLLAQMTFSPGDHLSKHEW